MAQTEAQKRASRKYDLKATKHYGLKFTYKYDGDIIAKLDSVDSKNDYVRQLIRADIKGR